ncbi:MAG: hypothetical protein Q4D26_03790 [Clostridia bacterium]|nr:hypothetical protein [Clostridia bacterium]
MACFLVPAAEAIVTTIAAKATEAKKESLNEVKIDLNNSEAHNMMKIPFSKKLKWLSNLLWGGSVLLAFEHIWHGEVVPWFPFLTAAADPAETTEMFREITSAGVSMAVLVTAVWIGMVLVTKALENKPMEFAKIQNKEDLA